MTRLDVEILLAVFAYANAAFPWFLAFTDQKRMDWANKRGLEL